jgi:hypothetical protein
MFQFKINKSLYVATNVTVRNISAPTFKDSEAKLKNLLKKTRILRSNQSQNGIAITLTSIPALEPG